MRDPLLTGAVPAYTEALDREESQQRRTDLLGRGVMACLDKTIAMLRTATASSPPEP